LRQAKKVGKNFYFFGGALCAPPKNDLYLNLKLYPPTLLSDIKILKEPFELPHSALFYSLVLLN
jgi:hypothetical protein